MSVAVRVRVPATSANLGSGFDAAALALTMSDEVTVRPRPAGLTVDVSGEGADAVPRDESHLVVRALRDGLAAWGGDVGGLAVSCDNRIPHCRGLGSSAAAVVAGLVAARALATGDAVTDTEVLQRAAAWEGHPDNVAACLFGGVTVAWTDGGTGRVEAVRLEPAEALAASVFVPTAGFATRAARELLPAEVPHVDAAFNVARAALLTHALTTQPDLLWAATEDRLHQPYRAEAMPATAALVARLRGNGFAAAVSGAGPTVLAVGMRAALARLPEAEGFRTHRLGIDLSGATVDRLPG